MPETNNTYKVTVTMEDGIGHTGYVQGITPPEPPETGRWWKLVWSNFEEGPWNRIWFFAVDKIRDVQVEQV